MKRFFCILLTLSLVAALILPASAVTIWPDGTTADEAIAAYETETGEKLETRRYYFMMPDGVHGIRNEFGGVCESWYNEYSQGAGVYWWKGPAACPYWTGYKASVADAEQGIWYVDMPVQVETFLWNNGVDGGMDPMLPIFSMMKMSVDIPCEYAEPGEWETMPEGCENYNNCIFILSPFDLSISPMTVRDLTNGAWYFYYGDGCYGMYAEDSENFTDVASNCCNPDHFDENGNHVGFPASLRGDYDWDNDITIMDATRAQYIIAGLFTGANPAHTAKVDADADGELTILDATRIQRVLADLCDWNGISWDEYELPIMTPD